MNAVVKTMAAPLDVRWDGRGDVVRQIDGVWFLDPVSAKPFDTVVVATPAEQAAPLLVSHAPAMAAACPRHGGHGACLSFNSSWTVMVA
jgi:renalase